MCLLQVGEPIAYPHINQLCALLHSKQISSFMVTNAQYPDRIRSLGPVTQLYVSIDAATKDSLQVFENTSTSINYACFVGD